MPVNLSFIPVLFLAGGAVLLANGIRWRRELRRQPNDWVEVEGMVVEIRRGGADSFFPVVQYRGPDGLGRRVHGAASVVPDLHHEGQEVAVLLDPKNPRRARLADLQQETGRLTTQFLVGGPVLLVLGIVAAIVLR